MAEGLKSGYELCCESVMKFVPLLRKGLDIFHLDHLKNAKLNSMELVDG
jgi:hypothetical protein